MRVLVGILLVACLVFQVLMAQDDATASSTPAETGVIMEGLTAEQEAALSEGKESFEFQAEVNRLMDIIINSLCKYPRSAVSAMQMRRLSYTNLFVVRLRNRYLFLEAFRCGLATILSILKHKPSLATTLLFFVMNVF